MHFPFVRVNGEAHERQLELFKEHVRQELLQVKH